MNQRIAVVSLSMLLVVGCKSYKSSNPSTTAQLSVAPAAQNIETLMWSRPSSAIELKLIPGVQDVDAPMNTEAYKRIEENPFLSVIEHPLSTFSIDVDTASYSNVRRFLNSGNLPPKDAVRIEELINYFAYDYPPPQDDNPFAVHAEATRCPWEPAHYLARIGIKGRVLDTDKRPPCNLVFLIDVSGSMADENKLSLVKKAMRRLVDNLAPEDRVAVVVYAGASGLVLPSTPLTERKTILRSLSELEAGGSTNGGAGIQLAYATAEANLVEGGNNRVILATDGDFNVGVTNEGDLTRLIEEKKKSGIFLTVLGFGMMNYKDSTLEALADLGNGNYAYIDNLREAEKVFVHQLLSTLFTIAKDVKIQVEFNPGQIAGYRLIGYENRMLEAEEFNNDKKDAGEIGAGHTVTALYELVPFGTPVPTGSVGPLKYQEPPTLASAASANELMTVKLRYKAPAETDSKLIAFAASNFVLPIENASPDLRFAGAVAAFGMLLRDSPHKGGCTFDMAFELAKSGLGESTDEYREEFLTMVKQAQGLRRSTGGAEAKVNDAKKPK